VLEGLQVHEGRMAENMELTRGLIFSEAVAMVLREKLGRSQSHQLLEDASRRTVEQDQSLQDVLLNDVKVREHLSAEEIAGLMDPKNYIGSAKELAQKVLSSLDRKL
jgi:3-carboxy-cis,cis-muconate cycloisomerase